MMPIGMQESMLMLMAMLTCPRDVDLKEHFANLATAYNNLCMICGSGDVWAYGGSETPMLGTTELGEKGLNKIAEHLRPTADNSLIEAFQKFFLTVDDDRAKTESDNIPACKYRHEVAIDLIAAVLRDHLK